MLWFVSYRNLAITETYLPLLLWTWTLYCNVCVYLATVCCVEFEVCSSCADLVSVPKELCLCCHHVHTQHFPELDISQYLQTDMGATNLDSGQNQRCTFCHELMNPRIPAQTKPLTSGGGSGLDSLRLACAVRPPQNELEFSLAGGWIVGRAEIQKNILQSAITPEHCQGEKDTGELMKVIKMSVLHLVLHITAAGKQHEAKGKATPTPKTSSKMRRIGF